MKNTQSFTVILGFVFARILEIGRSTYKKTIEGKALTVVADREDEAILILPPFGPFTKLPKFVKIDRNFIEKPGVGVQGTIYKDGKVIDVEITKVDEKSLTVKGKDGLEVEINSNIFRAKRVAPYLNENGEVCGFSGEAGFYTGAIKLFVPAGQTIEQAFENRHNLSFVPLRYEMGDSNDDIPGLMGISAKAVYAHELANMRVGQHVEALGSEGDYVRAIINEVNHSNGEVTVKFNSGATRVVALGETQVVGEKAQKWNVVRLGANTWNRAKIEKETVKVKDLTYGEYLAYTSFYEGDMPEVVNIAALNEALRYNLYWHLEVEDEA